MCGDGDIYIAGGVESMTRAPFVMAKSDSAFGRAPEMYDTTMGWRFINKKFTKDTYYPYTMGETAENVAAKYNVSREAQDEFSLRSQQRYFAAKAAGKFNDEITPVTIDLGKGKTMVFDADEHPRETTLEKMAALKPAFKKDGTVTAGNSSGINDGACALILASAEAVKKYNLKPIAKIKGMAIAGVDPAIMGMGPVPASQKALKRAGIEAKDLDLIELNEAFAAQGIPCLQELGLDADKVNVNGGAIAIGHPLGCSGARISTTLLYELTRRGGKYGLATMCIGVGQGAAIVYEMV
jgi:acetyl-CoA C-acetyltransferase